MAFDICFSNELSPIDSYYASNGNIPNLEKLACKDIITGETKCVDHERITEVAKLQILQQVSLYKLIHLSGDLLPPSLYVPYINMLTGLASNSQSALHCFELLKANGLASGGPSSSVSWNHIFVSLIQYYSSLRREMATSSEVSQRAPHIRGITLKELEGLISVLKLANVIAEKNDVLNQAISKMLHLSTATLNFIEYVELSLEEIQTTPLLLEQLLNGRKNMYLKIRNLLIEPMHMFYKDRKHYDDMNDIIQAICSRTYKLDEVYIDIKMSLLKLNLDNNTFSDNLKALTNLQNESSLVEAMLCKAKNQKYVMKEDINEQKSELKTKLDCLKKLVDAEFTDYFQYMEYCDKPIFKIPDYKRQAILLDGYKDSNIAQERNTPAENTHIRTMEKQIKTSKTSQEPRREKVPSKPRVYSAQPDRGSVEILDGRYLVDLLLSLKDRPHVVFPASHPLLMAKIRFIGQSSELNTFLHRIRSFVLGENPKHVSWPDDAMVRPLPLACSGFSYEGNGKEIVCKYCGFKTDTDSWNDNDEKYGMSIHRKAGTCCPFMNSFIDSEVVIPEDDDDLDQEQFQVNTLYFLFCQPETCFQDINILNTFFTGRRIQYSQPIIVEELVDELILNELIVKQKHIFDKHFSNDKKQYRKNMSLI